jgi:hypothetical protein
MNGDDTRFLFESLYGSAFEAQAEKTNFLQGSV